MRMHVLSGGTLRMRRGVYYPDAAPDAMLDMPVSCFLIKHEQGLVLFDTGCHPALPLDPTGRWGGLSKFIIPIFSEQDTLIHQLPLAGVVPQDIDVVLCSHLHPDHCGCNAFFPRATVLAQASEIAAAAKFGATAGYLEVEYELPNPIQPVDGDRDLFGDGRITLLHVPGHTPGMMAAHVVLERHRTFVLASDSIAVRAHLDERFTPKNTWDADKGLASIDRIAGLQKDGATVLFGHDAEQWATLRKGADFYT